MRISDWSSDVCSSDLKSERFTLHCRDHAVPTSDWASFARFCRHRIMPLQRVRDGAANLGDISKVVLASESSGAACANFHSQRFEPEGSLICLVEFPGEGNREEGRVALYPFGKPAYDRKSGVYGKRVSVREELRG